jgi:hypothetical protein
MLWRGERVAEDVIWVKPEPLIAENEGVRGEKGVGLSLGCPDLLEFKGDNIDPASSAHADEETLHACICVCPSKLLSTLLFDRFML